MAGFVTSDAVLDHIVPNDVLNDVLDRVHSTERSLSTSHIAIANDLETCTTDELCDAGTATVPEATKKDELLPSSSDKQPSLDEVTRALLQRKQPLMELVSSEEGYVRRLRMVRDYYMPIISSVKASSTSHGAESSVFSTQLPPSTNPPGAPGDPAAAPVNPPPIPDDLAARWRIVWGNWIQLCEWHSSFLEKLKLFVDSDPDKIPKLFIDSRARLRSIYSKYCENHRKAALITEQYRDYFEELRAYLNDKEDVVSYLMQPVQRIMRYQLPMAEIVKYTQRACCPELSLWKKALDIMKEIPKDTQLILEAARIEGFPGVITALGNILIRGDLLVATTTRDQLLEAVTGYRHILQECFDAHPASKHNSAALSTRSTVPSSPGTSMDSSSTGIVSTNTSELTASSELTGLYTGNLKFVESRVFLFEQMLLITEENKPKRRVTSSDTFSQSTFLFRSATNVNKMRYESHWYNCTLQNGHTNADAVAVDQLLSTGLAPDDFRFAILDQTPGRDTVYVIDPVSCANREAWVVQLRDIQRMQHEFLLALQDPRRFKTGKGDDTWNVEVSDTTDSAPSLPHPCSPTQVLTVHNTSAQPQPRQRKWPSFTMKRPTRLGSTSSPSNCNRESPSSAVKSNAQSPCPVLDQTPSGRAANQFTRSLSAERGHLVRMKLDLSPNPSESKNILDTDQNETFFRKSSFSANSSLKGTIQVRCTDSPASVFPDANVSKGSTGANKKRNVFANLFTRNKSKHRGKPTSHHHQPSSRPAPQPSLPIADSSEGNCDCSATVDVNLTTASSADTAGETDTPNSSDPGV